MGLSDEQKTDYYSVAEVEELLISMERPEVARILSWFTAQKCEERTGLTAHDIYQQLVEKLLSASSSRSWKRGLSAVTYFCLNGKSIISNESNRSEVAANYRATKSDQLAETASLLNSPHGAESNSLQQVAEQQQSEEIVAVLTEKIFAMFKDDTEAECYLNQKINESKKSTILRICEFTDQVYRNVEKRIKDKVSKRFPNGLPFGE